MFSNVFFAESATLIPQDIRFTRHDSQFDGSAYIFENDYIILFITLIDGDDLIRGNSLVTILLK